MRLRLVALTVMVGFALLVVGCGSSESTSDETTQPPGDSSTTAAASSTTVVEVREPCDPSNPHPSGLTEYTLMSGGVERTYFVHVPEGYAAEVSWPVIVGLHGITWSAADWFNATWKASAVDLDHILVLPEAANLDWADRSVEPDVPFILGVLDDAAQRVCIDSTRVYASGGSDGADMVTRLACEAGDRFAAVRPYIGMNYPEIFESEGCDQPVPVPMTSYIGTEEPYYDPADIEAGLTLWAERNGCQGDPVTEDVADGVTVTRYVDCSQDAIVELYTLEGVEHEAAQVECEGNDPGFCVTYPFDTTRTMLEFFAQYSR